MQKKTVMGKPMMTIIITKVTVQEGMKKRGNTISAIWIINQLVTAYIPRGLKNLRLLASAINENIYFNN